MKLTLNPYALVFTETESIYFILSDSAHPVRFVPSDLQLGCLKQLYQGDFFEYEYLCSLFGKAQIDELIRTGCLVSDLLDTQTIHSRSNAFFLTHHMLDARKQLAQKKVLILGCGGIGTHLAWHMTTLGIAKLTLVDFDAVEESNLNRQVLFDCFDIGKSKVEVLKQKLAAINHEMKIETICTHISSEKELEEICLSDSYDLVIKSLDTPHAFPLWFDQVTHKNAIPYITGITMRENVLIGPSFIPGKSTYGWCELIGYDNKAEKLFGISPSLGIMLYHISAELAIEAFKILTGYGKLKFFDTILCKNLFTEEETYFKKDKSPNQDISSSVVRHSSISRKMLLFDIVTILILAVSGIFSYHTIPFAFLSAIILPFLICKTTHEITRCTFVNASFLTVPTIIILGNIMNMDSHVALVSAIAVMIGVQSAIMLFLCIISYLICVLSHKDS